MKELIEKLKELFSFSGKTVRFVNVHIGLRDLRVEPLPAPARAAFNRAMQLWTTLILLCAAGYAGLLYWVRGKVDSVLEQGVPLASVEILWSNWQLTTAGAVALAVVLAVLAAWAWSLRRRFNLRAGFLLIPLGLVLLCAGFRPAARWAVEGRLFDLFNHGDPLFQSSHWEASYLYYWRLYSVFPNCFISDNCLGRMAGSRYGQKEFEHALEYYARILTVFPDTDIRQQARQSLEWSMSRAGQVLPAGRCAQLYDELSLGRLEVSAFRFFLGQPTEAEECEPRRFGSITGEADSKKLAGIRTLLERYPNDPWAARAAFHIGDRERLFQYTNSAYFRSYGVVRGWHLQSRQQYEDAARLYEDFLSASPPQSEALKVRGLLARCYLASMQLDQALTNLLSGAKGEVLIPSTTYHLFLERFAYLDSAAEAGRLFDSVHLRLPYLLAADMAHILRERLELEEALTPEARADYVKYAQRTLRLAPAGPEEYNDTVSRFIQQRFDYGSNLVRFANSRLGETSDDRQRRHYFDRNYGVDARMWPDSGNTTYTGLLGAYVERHAAAMLAEAGGPPAAFAVARTLVSRLSDPALVDRAIQNYCDQLLKDDSTLDLPTIRILSEISRPAYRDRLETLSLGTLLAQPASPEGVSNAFQIVACFPTPTNRAALRELVSACLRRTGGAEGREQALAAVGSNLHQSSRRTLLLPEIGPVLLEGYAAAATNRLAAAGIRERFLALGLCALRDLRTYPCARAVFTRYLETYPADALAENARLWLAWLACYDAYEQVDDSAACAEACRRATALYEHVAAHSRQERIRNLAQESGRRLRRKLRLMETGAMRAGEFAIPAEIVFWGNPRERLSGTVWSLGKPGDRFGRQEMTFGGKRLVIANAAGKVEHELEYRLHLGPSGFEVRAAGAQGGNALVFQARITKNVVIADLIRIAPEGGMKMTRYVGQLAAGEIARQPAPKYPPRAEAR